MNLIIHLILYLVALRRVWCMYELCESSRIQVLNDEECNEFFFEPSEGGTNLGHINLHLEGNNLNITPSNRIWDVSYLRITQQNKQNKKICMKLSKNGADFYCVKFAQEANNETFLLEYKAEKLPETTSIKIIFALPSAAPKVQLFPYIDISDTSHLIVKAQKLPNFNDKITNYKIETFKEKHEITTLQDLQFISNYNEFHYEFITYNNEGQYFFIITEMNENCEDYCPKLATPKVFIARKSMRLVIGIVGASFILPFLMFLFHILTKKYQNEESQTEPKERLLIVYQSSFKKHNEVVAILAKLLGKLCKNHTVEMVDLTKKMCNDSLIFANKMVYVAPPKHETPIIVDKILADKEFVIVIFDYCLVPEILANRKIFKLFQEFNQFIDILDISETYKNHNIYRDLKRKTDEAKMETDHFINDNVPKIIITQSESQECEALMSPK